MNNIDTMKLSYPHEVPDYGYILDVTNSDNSPFLIILPTYISYDVNDNNDISLKYDRDSIGIPILNEAEKKIQQLIYDSQSDWLDQYLTKSDIRMLTKSIVRDSNTLSSISCNVTQELLNDVLTESRPFSPEIKIDHVLCKHDSFCITLKLNNIIRNNPEVHIQEKCNDTEYPTDSKSMEEVTIDPPKLQDSIKLSDPNEIYKQMYKIEKRKARDYRRSAIDAYLKAKDIKMRYMTKDIEISDDSDEEKLSFKNSEI